jgi:SET domain-containing protein
MKIEVRTSKYGRGVFAKEPIEKGSILETCPVLLLPESNQVSDLDSQLQRYQFDWINNLKGIALGLGSIYNHDLTPSAIFLPNYDTKEIIFIALRDILKDEEVLINYGYNPVSNAKIELALDFLSNTKTLSQWIIDQTIEQIKRGYLASE